MAFEAAQHFLDNDLATYVSPAEMAKFRIDQPKVVEEDIASGDKFFASEEDLATLREELPSVACVEMEGASVAQVCYEHGVPFLIIRTVSDTADEAAPIDFPRFIERVASAYSHGILRNLFKRLYLAWRDED
jgi:adenosylhomocysteine nucleosidase